MELDDRRHGRGSDFRQCDQPIFGLTSSAKNCI